MGEERLGSGDDLATGKIVQTADDRVAGFVHRLEKTDDAVTMNRDQGSLHLRTEVVEAAG